MVNNEVITAMGEKWSEGMLHTVIANNMRIKEKTRPFGRKNGTSFPLIVEDIRKANSYFLFFHINVDRVGLYANSYFYASN